MDSYPVYRSPVEPTSSTGRPEGRWLGREDDAYQRRSPGKWSTAASSSSRMFERDRWQIMPPLHYTLCEPYLLSWLLTSMSLLLYAPKSLLRWQLESFELY